LNTKTNRKERFIISFFGIKGIGSFYYLSFALNEHTFPNQDKLWSILGLTVLLSVILHGVTATFALKKIEEDLSVKS
ncbi:MAG TPA: cation:proton antiporter, partial [Cytophagales bacterium]|nr:cation:proton antiporter [Cytophagales bacterium]